MTNGIQVFSNQEFGSIRTIEIDDIIYFVGKDVCEVLGYTNPSKALADHVDEYDKLNNESLSSLGQRGGWLINESGLYSLILSSKLPTAKKFKSWITSEVLPTIRKHGAYMTEETLEKALTSPDFLIQLATKLKEEKEKNVKLEAKIEEDKPKVKYHDDVINTGNLIITTNIAKDLGYRSAQPLNKILIKNKIIFPKKNKDGKLKGYEVTANYNWLITENYADYQIFKEKNSSPCLKFTEKGRQWIIDNVKNHKWDLVL